MGERALIEAFVARLADAGPAHPAVLLGPGDDAAVVRARPGPTAVQVLSVDTTVLGVHLPADDDRVTPADAGHRALATALSDLAAMGVAAGEAYVALTIPPWWTDAAALELLDGMRALAAATGTALAGGDVSSGPGLVVTVTVVGWADGGDAVLRRSGAGPGDRVGVTGVLGGSAAGFAVLGGAPPPSDPGVAAGLRQRYLRPDPRLALGTALREAGASAAIDLSDGVATDAAHLARASGARLVVDVDLLPRQEGVDAVARATGADPARMAACGGEDFELLVTAPPDRAEGMDAVSWVGEVREGEGAAVLERDGRPLDWTGFEHRAGRAAGGR